MWNEQKHHIGLLASLCCLVVLFACRSGRTGASNESSGNISPIEVTTLAKGTYSGIDEQIILVIESIDAWAELWEKVHTNISPSPELPTVDFSSETVIAAFMGSRPTGGYSIRIDLVRACDNRIKAIVITESPEPGDMVTMALTQPYHIATVNVTGKEIEFKK